MEVTTKKKRGRPRRYTEYENDDRFYLSGREGRNLQNYVNADTLIELLYGLGIDDETVDDIDNEYASVAECFIYRHANDGETPHYRYQGVAEQIGRMYNAGRIDELTAYEMAKAALYKIEVGYTSREVEKALRQYHKALRISVAATKKELG